MPSVKLDVLGAGEVERNKQGKPTWGGHQQKRGHSETQTSSTSPVVQTATMSKIAQRKQRHLSIDTEQKCLQLNVFL